MSLATVDERPTALSPAQRQKAKLEAFMGHIASRSEQFGTLLADSQIDPKLFLETCRRAIMKDPELLNCDPATFIQSAMNCAGDGLVPDGRKAAFVRYKSAVQYIPMYQGLLEIAHRSQRFQSIEAQVVYKGDDFDYALGDMPFIRHRRSLEADSREIIGAYAVAKTTNGGVIREVVGKKDLAQIRAVSRASKGPNADWPGEMARKGALRRLWKWLPKTPAMERVLEHDDATYETVTAANAPRLHADFDAPAIEAEVISETVANPGDEAGEASTVVTQPRPQTHAAPVTNGDSAEDPGLTEPPETEGPGPELSGFPGDE